MMKTNVGISNTVIVIQYYIYIWWIKWKAMLVRIDNHFWFVSDWENGYWWRKIVTNISISIYLDKGAWPPSSEVERKNWWHQGWKKWKAMLVRLDNNFWWEDECMGISMTTILLTNVCLFCTKMTIYITY